MSANSRLTVAVHALCWLELARRRGHEPLTSTEIAASLASNPVLIRRTLAPLRDAGLLAVVGRGPGSGWRLARGAEQITVAEVHRLLRDDDLIGLHAHQPNQECPVGFGIRPVLSALYAQAEKTLEIELARHTIAEILDTVLRDHPLQSPTTSSRTRGPAVPSGTSPSG